MTEEEAPRHNLVALTLSQAVIMGTGVVLQVFLARWLGQEGFGTFAYLAGLLGLFQFAAHLNMISLIGREVARAPETAGRTLSLGLVTTACLSWVGFVTIVPYVWLTDGRPEIVFASAFTAVAMGVVGLPLVGEGVLLGLRWMQPFFRANLTGRAVVFVLTIALVLAGAGVPGVFAAQAVGSVAAALVYVHLYVKRYGSPSFDVSFAQVRGLVRDASPFALNMLFDGIYITADVLVVQWFHGEAAVGIYRVAAILVLTLPMVASILVRALYARMARNLGDRHAAGAELSFALRVMLLISVPIAVGGMLVAEPLIVALVGEEYRLAWIPLTIMLPVVPMRYLNQATGMTLSALNRQTARTRAVFAVALVNVVLNLAFIPTLAGSGAALATLATEVVLGVLSAVLVAPLVRDVAVVRSLLLPLLAAAVMAVVVWVTPGHVFVRIAVGAAVYAATAWVIGAWRLEDVRRLRAL